MRVTQCTSSSVLAESLPREESSLDFLTFIYNHIFRYRSAIIGWNRIVFLLQARRATSFARPGARPTANPWKYFAIGYFSLTFLSNPMSRETHWNAIRICTAHKHTKLKKAWPSRPEFFHLSNTKHVRFAFCQKYSMYKDGVCAYKKNVRFHKMRIRSFVARCVKYLSRPPRFCTLGEKIVPPKVNARTRKSVRRGGNIYNTDLQRSVLYTAN